MSAVAHSPSPLQISIGRQFSLPVTYSGSVGGPATITTGMTIDAALTWTGQAAPLPIELLDRDDLGGTLVLRLGSDATVDIPNDRVMTLRVSYTDSVGETDDILFAAWGVVP